MIRFRRRQRRMCFTLPVIDKQLNAFSLSEEILGAALELPSADYLIIKLFVDYFEKQKAPKPSEKQSALHNISYDRSVLLTSSIFLVTYRLTNYTQNYITKTKILIAELIQY